MIRRAPFDLDESQWFDMHSTDNPHSRHQDNKNDEQLDEAATIITQIVQRETAIIGTSKTFLGGISQGCATAIYVLLRDDQSLAGFIGMSSWFPRHQRILDPKEPLETPVYLSHNHDDPTISIPFGEALRDGLVGLGMVVEWHVYGDDIHWINEPKGIDDMVAFLQRYMRS